MQALLTAAFHQVCNGNQVTERALEKVHFGQHGNGLSVCFGVSRGEFHRIQVRCDVSLGWRSPLDLKDGSCVTQKFSMTNATRLGNINVEIQSKSIDVFAAHPHDFLQNIFAHNSSTPIVEKFKARSKESWS